MKDTSSKPGRLRIPRAPTTAMLVWSFVALIGLLALIVAWQFVEPAPPKQVRLATGSPGGAYELTGDLYARWFAQKGVQLETVETAGSVENWELLLSGAVDAALVQSGTAPAAAADELEAVVSVALEPLFLFHRLLPDEPEERASSLSDHLEGLAGGRIAIGAERSGTQHLMRALLPETGLDDRLGDIGAELVAIGGREAADALESGAVDAAAFVMAPQAPLVERLLAAESIGLVHLRQAAGLAQRLPYLSAVTLFEGVVDPRRNLPPRAVHMIAPATYLVVRQDTHRSVLQLLIEAAQRSPTPHLVGSASDFPSLEYTDIPIAEDARYFFERGPNILHRHLPFWAASLIDRMAILIIPLLTVIIPLFRIAPAALQWSMRRRIFRWYRQVRLIDEDLARGDLPRSRLESDLALLLRLDQDVSATEVPLSYMEEFYNLRLHIAYMRHRVRDLLAEDRSETENGT